MRMLPEMAEGSALQWAMAQWSPILEARMAVIAGVAGYGGQAVTALADPLAGLPTAATFVGVDPDGGSLSPTWTYTEAPYGFDSPLDLTDPASWVGILPFVKLNGTDEYISSPDAAWWTLAGGLSIEAWVWMPTGAANYPCLIGKWDDAAAAREWMLFYDCSTAPPAQRLSFLIYDDVANADIGRRVTPGLPPDTWHHIIATWDGVGAAANLRIYSDGIRVDDANTGGGGAFVAMQDTASAVTIGRRADLTNPSYYPGRVAGGGLCPIVTDTVIPPAEVARLYRLGRQPLGLL